jgi:hypothetical protein
MRSALALLALAMTAVLDRSIELSGRGGGGAAGSVVLAFAGAKR